MFCAKCGTQLSETAEFCTNCGTKIVKEEKKNVVEKITDTEIQLRVQPSFKFVYKILSSIIIYSLLFFLLFLPLCMIDILGVVLFLIALVIMIIAFCIKAVFNKKQYDSCCYEFYKTKAVYKDSFLNLSEREVKYKDIKEVTMRQTFMQKYFNIGNIMLFTDAENGTGNSICIFDVENVQDIYNSIKSIIGI